ncbi:MAG: ArsR family transcriptional regulator [Methanobrevibacter sp.]|jgi:predicted transcriptional regulator|nr:ArsR family transcriptional regulator [Candidatus Methanoflexus mossambicus]
MEQKLIDAIALVSRSEYREKILFDLKDKVRTPSKISKSTGIQASHISKYLKSLREADLIVCLNPGANQGRIYMITELGTEVLKHI